MNKLLRQAFTLIELLVVIAIIGILSGLIVVSMGGVTQKATIAKAQVFSSSLRNSLMLNLIAEYKLDGNANDTWGGHTAGTISGAVTQASCVQENCYSFDGTDDFIELVDSPDLRMTTGGTISAWIYPKTIGGSGAGRILDKGTSTSAANGYMIFINSTISLALYINGGSTTLSSSNALTLNQWQLITVSFDSSGRKMYINGVDKISSGGALVALPPDVAGVVNVGNRASATDRAFNGYIDEIRIYNVVMPISQIKEQYYIGLNKLLSNKGITQEEYISRLNDYAQN